MAKVDLVKEKVVTEVPGAPDMEILMTEKVAQMEEMELVRRMLAEKAKALQPENFPHREQDYIPLEEAILQKI